MKVACLVVLCQTEGYQGTCAMPPDSRTEWLRTIKQLFKSAVKVNPCSSTLQLECLPASPRALPQEIYQKAYPGEPPVLSKLTELQLEHLKSGTRTRAPRAGHGLGVSSSLSIWQPFHGMPQMPPQMHPQMPFGYPRHQQQIHPGFRQ